MELNFTTLKLLARHGKKPKLSPLKSIHTSLERLFVVRISAMNFMRTAVASYLTGFGMIAKSRSFKTLTIRKGDLVMIMNLIYDYQFAKARGNKNLERYALVKIAAALRAKGYTAKDIERVRGINR